MPTPNDKLVMTFEANTIKHLGVKMYSTMPPALAELIANAFDACATEVFVKLYDDKTKKVIVQDNGIGMSFDQVNDYFLRIGRNRREENQESPCGRTPTGKKGLGKLALFGIGDTINITTCQGEEGVSFNLDWKEIQKWKGSDYEPTYEIIPKDSCIKGTTITLTNLKRKTRFPLEEYAESIAKLFNFEGEFVIKLSLNDGKPIIIDSKSKYNNVVSEFEWEIQEIIKINENDYSEKNNIIGKIITTEKPLKTNLRGITLFANGRMVNSAEFFGPSESSHFYSYATGWLNIDFIDNWSEDVISTNRQSIDWENPLTTELRKYIASCISIIERQWRQLRKEKKQKKITEKTKVNVPDWLSKLPDDVQSQVETIVNILDDTPELSEESQQKSIQIIHSLVPEYPQYHWRHLHEIIQDASKVDYERADYYRAFIEAAKRYINEVRGKSSSVNSSDSGMMGEVFGRSKFFNVCKNYKKTDGSDFTSSTLENIEDGQKYLSMGMVSGGRNPVSHEEINELSITGLFSEKDCLDFLSLLSHLFRRLYDAEKQ
ncbi:MAG: TIGR02391 family protein [Ignavibacteriaceae bacterium]|nr:TIGR02391 family protein [Ignavibacteriaceae bacterium]